jgi:hypothetical protein
MLSTATAAQAMNVDTLLGAIKSSSCLVFMAFPSQKTHNSDKEVIGALGILPQQRRAVLDEVPGLFCHARNGKNRACADAQILPPGGFIE